MMSFFKDIGWHFLKIYENTFIIVVNNKRSDTKLLYNILNMIQANFSMLR